MDTETTTPSGECDTTVVVRMPRGAYVVLPKHSNTVLLFCSNGSQGVTQTVDERGNANKNRLVLSLYTRAKYFQRGLKIENSKTESSACNSLFL